MAAARAAFDGWSRTPPGERLAGLEALAAICKRRRADMAGAMSSETGAPKTLAVNAQAAAGLGHIDAFICAIRTFRFEHPFRDDAPEETIIHEPVGVRGPIVPWK